MNGFMLMASEGSDVWNNVLNTVVDWCMSVGKNILIAIVIMIVGNRLVKWLMKHISKSISKTKIEPIVGKFLSSIIKFLLYFLVSVIVIELLGIPTASIVAAFGTAGLTIGFALQGSLSNFAGGVIILLFKPFRIGDYILEDTHHNEGTVTGIDLCYTRILTIDNKTVVIPNGSLANSSLTNYTANGKRKLDMEIAISYEANMKQAKSVIESCVKARDKVMLDEGIDVFVKALEDSQVTIGVRAWVATDDYWPVRWALNEEIKEALDANNIEIPYNQLAVTLKGKYDGKESKQKEQEENK